MYYTKITDNVLVTYFKDNNTNYKILINKHKEGKNIDVFILLVYCFGQCYLLLSNEKHSNIN